MGGCNIFLLTGLCRFVLVSEEERTQHLNPGANHSLPDTYSPSLRLHFWNSQAFFRLLSCDYIIVESCGNLTVFLYSDPIKFLFQDPYEHNSSSNV